MREKRELLGPIPRAGRREGGKWGGGKAKERNDTTTPPLNLEVYP